MNKINYLCRKWCHEKYSLRDHRNRAIRSVFIHSFMDIPVFWISALYDPYHSLRSVKVSQSCIEKSDEPSSWVFVLLQLSLWNIKHKLRFQWKKIFHYTINVIKLIWKSVNGRSLIHKNPDFGFLCAIFFAPIVILGRANKRVYTAWIWLSRFLRYSIIKADKSPELDLTRESSFSPDGENILLDQLADV